MPATSVARAACVQDIIVRSARRVFRPFVRPLAFPAIAGATAAFLNSFLGGAKPRDTVTAQLSLTEQLLARMRSAIHTTTADQPAATGTTGAPGSTGSAALPAAEMWAEIARVAKEHFGYELTQPEQTAAKTLATLRSFCLKTGIQVRI